MPNVSELQRMEEELEELFDLILDKTKYYPKSQRANLLSQIRLLEDKLGLKGASYNSEEFSKDVSSK